MKDLMLNDLSTLTNDVYSENMRQLRTWGIQDHPPFTWLAFLTEEVGELSQAMSEVIFRDGLKDNVYKEAIQVATLALKIAEMYKP